MKHLLYILILLLVSVTFLWGCRQSTTVILPPVSTVTTAPTVDPSPTLTASSSKSTETAMESSPGETADTEQSTPSATSDTQPTTVPAATAVTDPTTIPITWPTVMPTAEPTAEPITAPSAEPTAALSTEPITEPTTEATAVPVTESTTEPTALPSTSPTTVPAEEPTTEPAGHSVYDISGHRIGSQEYALLDAVNQQRHNAGLSDLQIDPNLCALAAIRAYECEESFTHTRPDGRPAGSVLSDYSYNIWSTVDERIHSGTTGLSAGIIIKGWMQNDDFCADILSDTFQYIGIGLYINGDTTYIVCLFAG